MRRFVGVLLLLLALLYLLRRRLLARWLRLSAPDYGVRVARDIAVPMRDGARLMTDHYAPAGDGDYPTVLIRSSYGRGRDALPLGLEFLARRFAERGYHVVVQTTRGQFDSEGAFTPYVHEQADGLATIAWIERQPWFNGVLGTWGPSYLGVVQWAIAGVAPDSVRAMVPIITGSNVSTLQFPDGAFALDTSLRWAISTGAMGGDQRQSALRRNLQMEQVMAETRDHLPLRDADAAAIGQAVPFYREWLENPPWADGAEIWARADHRHEVAQTRAAVHLITGWYDIWVRELLADYAALRDAGRNPYLTIGPWPHISRGPMAVGLQEGIIWLDAHLKGKKDRLREKPVRICIMGTGEWRELETWPPPAREERWYLAPAGALSTVPPPAGAAPSRYTYDPADPTPVAGGTQFNAGAGRKAQTAVEARDDVLVYTSDPLATPLEIMGAIRLTLYVSSTLAHTDFVGRLCDVGPDGVSLNVCDGLFRLAPGGGEPREAGTVRVTVDLWATAYCFQPGHRLRVQVASAAHPRWSRNTGSGEPLGTAIELRVAEQTIYHDADHPSALILPVTGGNHG